MVGDAHNDTQTSYLGSSMMHHDRERELDHAFHPRYQHAEMSRPSATFGNASHKYGGGSSAHHGHHQSLNSSSHFKKTNVLLTQLSADILSIISQGEKSVSYKSNFQL